MDNPASAGARRPADALHGIAPDDHWHLSAHVDRHAAHSRARRDSDPDGLPTSPPRVEYELSDRGRSLKVALAPIGNWVMENENDIEEARERFREQSPQDSADVGD